MTILPSSRIQSHTYDSGRRFIWILIGFVCLMACYGITNLVSLRVVVSGISMEPELRDGDWLVASRIYVPFLQRGQIVVLQPERTGSLIIKRLIGLPGEIIEIRHQQVYIDGNLLSEPYLWETCLPDQCSERFWQLGPDEYFVLGDNRNSSDDSRYFGTLSQSQIRGVVLFRYWPIVRSGM